MGEAAASRKGQDPSYSVSILESGFQGKRRCQVCTQVPRQVVHEGPIANVLLVQPLPDLAGAVRRQGRILEERREFFFEKAVNQGPAGFVTGMSGRIHAALK